LGGSLFDTANDVKKSALAQGDSECIPSIAGEKSPERSLTRSLPPGYFTLHCRDVGENTERAGESMMR
jgi:hypothetical protein